MRRWLSTLTVALALLALAACAAQETAKEEAKEEAKPPAPAAPAAAGAPAAKPAWQQEWERLLAAAKREGRVAVAGPLGSDIREGLTEPFEKEFGISVEFLGQSGSRFRPRVEAEHAAGRYLWDMYIGGITSMLPLKARGFYQPVEPLLILPEAKDPKGWEGGLHFLDKDRQVFVMATTTSGAWFYNPKEVDPKQFKSWKDLLDPKWKGKVLIQDPRIGGTGQSRFQFFYLHPELGVEYIKALTPQLVISRDYRQQLDWVAEGRYPLLIGGHETLGDQLMEEGLPVARLNPAQLKEGGYLASSVSNLVLFKKNAHPNAAKLYVNWLLSKAGQTAYSRAARMASWRADVSRDHVPEARMPNIRFLDTATEEAHLARDKVREIALEVLGK